MKRTLYPIDLPISAVVATVLVALAAPGVGNIQPASGDIARLYDSKNIERSASRASETPQSINRHHHLETKAAEAPVKSRQFSQLFFRRSIVQLKSF
ncbi:hypothetical protein [Parasphingorhabdus cellanae]|uniref:Uncharacterized protein n=1 Tax=Parasphingorhabdus cellanae TaxID=2806553 RepID=A0ABX7TB02_9SPHN|nr:hypothetical protein [Parasphingorhabdus cellanae]QTD57478.1 hypothetical protein J4G78_08120 [Parasphingorhabdus cellanae]